MRAYRFQFDVDIEGGTGPHPFLNTDKRAAFMQTLGLGEPSGGSLQGSTAHNGWFIGFKAFDKGFIEAHSSGSATVLVTLWLVGEWATQTVQDALVAYLGVTRIEHVVTDITEVR